MTVIELPDHQAALLKVRAAAEGLGLNAWLQKLAEEQESTPRQPRKSAFGLLAEYGPGPSEEEIEENRREMFSGLGRDFE